jgi:pimeloyl-ACP methyl ester carboxylesterase
VNRLLHCRGSITLAVGALCLGLSACGTPSATPVTTTTLPSPIAVLSTTPTGAAAFEGPILRIAVPPLANGETLLPDRPVGQKTTSGTVKIAYRQFGSGPNLVLAMGERGSMTWWDPQFLQRLAASNRVTIFDDPAVGYSAPMTRPPSVQIDGDVLAGLIASLGLSNVTVVGWGMGGEVALSFAERHAGLAIGLVIVDGSAGGQSAVRPNAKTGALVGNPLTTLTQLANVMFTANTVGVTAKVKWLTNIAELEPDNVLFTTVAQQASAQNAYFQNDRVGRLLGAISIPTLIYVGAQDTVLPKPNSDQLARSIYHATYVVDPDAGYASIFQDSAFFLSHLSAIMKKITPTTTTTTKP